MISVIPILGILAITATLGGTLSPVSIEYRPAMTESLPSQMCVGSYCVTPYYDDQGHSAIIEWLFDTHLPNLTEGVIVEVRVADSVAYKWSIHGWSNISCIVLVSPESMSRYDPDSNDIQCLRVMSHPRQGEVMSVIENVWSKVRNVIRECVETVLVKLDEESDHWLVQFIVQLGNGVVSTVNDLRRGDVPTWVMLVVSVVLTLWISTRNPSDRKEGSQGPQLFTEPSVGVYRIGHMNSKIRPEFGFVGTENAGEFSTSAVTKQIRANPEISSITVFDF